MCTRGGGGSTVIMYAHGCTPINCREGKKKRKRKIKLVYRPPCGRLVFLCELKLHYFKKIEGFGGVGVANVCVMSEMGIKIKEGIMAEISLCFTTGERSK